MPDPILKLMALAASKAFGQKLAAMAASAFIEKLTGTDLTVSKAHKTRIAQLIEGQPQSWSSLNRIKAEAKFADRRGIMMIGPSGAGKTRLLERLTLTKQREETTTTLDHEFTALAGRMRAVYDAPGQLKFGSEVDTAIRKLRPKVLMFVVADGYLSVRSQDETPAAKYSYPDFYGHTKKKKLDTYLSATRAFEHSYLTDLAKDIPNYRKKPVKHLVFFVNKSELWHPNTTQDYSDEKFQEPLRGLFSKLCGDHGTLHVVHGSAEYRGFLGEKAANPKFDERDSLASISALKAFLAALLVDGVIK